MAGLDYTQRDRAVLRFMANGQSNLSQLAVGGQVVTNANIVRVIWSGDWQIKRNTTLVLDLINGGGVWDLQGAGIAITANSDQTIDVTRNTANGTLIIEVHKVCSNNAY